MRDWLKTKLFWVTGGLAASIPTVDLFLSGFFDEIYGLIVATIIGWLTKLGMKLEK